jgi:hypothetical protein
MRCTIAREQIQRLIVGERSPRFDALPVLAHLARCRQCRQEWRHCRQLRQAARNLPAPTLPAEHRARVLAEIAGMPVPTSAGETPSDAQKRRGTRMVQRTLILGVCVTAAIATLMLLTIHSPHRGVAWAMGDVKKALEHVNTWHLKGWKREGDKEIPWEVWGRRTPFFYHERIGGQETLDDGVNRTIVFPAGASNGNKRAVVLRIPSRPNTQSSMGLSFTLGLDRQMTNGNNKPWSRDGDTETFLREEMIIGSTPVIQVNGLFTFEKDSPLPIRYERLMRAYRVPKNAQGAYDFHDLQESAKEKEWTGTHLDAQYDIELDAAALHVAAPADAQQIDAVPDAAAPSMPTRNAATKNGLTLHVTQANVDARGDVLLCFEGFVGSVNFKGSHLPFSWDTAVRAGVIQDRLGNYQVTGYPNAIMARDERGRAYVAVTTLEFLRYIGDRNWLALTPLEPLQPGASPPHRLSFLMEMTLNTYQPLPEAQSGVSVELLNEMLPFQVELPTTYAEMDLKALSRQYGTPDNIEQRGFYTRFETAAVEARADAWQDVARDALNKAVASDRAGSQTDSERSARIYEAEHALQSAIHAAQEAAAYLPPRSANRIKSNLVGLKGMYSKEMPQAR